MDDASSEFQSNMTQRSDGIKFPFPRAAVAFPSLGTSCRFMYVVDRRNVNKIRGAGMIAYGVFRYGTVTLRRKKISR